MNIRFGKKEKISSWKSILYLNVNDSYEDTVNLEINIQHTRNIKILLNKK